MHQHAHAHLHTRSPTDTCADALDARARKRRFGIGWSNNNFKNLHFTISLETEEITTDAAENSWRFCVFF